MKNSRFHRELAGLRISILIPVRDEAALLQGLLAHLAALNGCHETIIAAYAPTDQAGNNNTDLSLPAEVKVIQGGPRHQRLNDACALASGEIILILPVDARPHPRAWAAIRAAVGRGAVAGCLRQRHDRRSFFYRWLEGCAALRAEWTGGAYMDQAPFFLRQAILSQGGFRAVGPYDTSDMARRLRRRGRFTVVACPVLISCRAWVQQGIVRTFLRYQCMRWNRLWRCRCGTSASR